jgi:hypothetical protein
LQAGFFGTTMTANNVTIEVNALSAVPEKTLALFIRNSTLLQPINLTVNASRLTSNNTFASAYITGGESNAENNASVLTINDGVLNANGNTPGIQESGHDFTLTIDPLSSCFLNNNPASCT